MADYRLVNQGIKWGGATYGTPGGTIYWSNWTRNFGGEAFQFSSGLSAQMVQEAEAAMRAWEAVANVTFVRVNDGASLNTTGLRLGMGSGDGPGGTEGLARRYSPMADNTTRAAQIWIDSGEGWQIRNGRVVDSGGNSFYQIALHEIGHVLGLAHYDGAVTVMNTAVNNITQLTAGDIAGVQYIYGPRAGQVDLTANVRSVDVDTRDGSTMHELGSLALVHYSLTNNSATTTTTAGTVGFYLSRDSVIDAGDRYLGSLSLDDTTIGTLTQLDVATYTRLPTDIATGEYFIGILADQDRMVTESNEGNNYSNGFAITIGIEGLKPLTPQEAFGLARLYNAGFGRNFDAAGLNYWIDRAEAGLPNAAIAANFLDSQEFTNRYGDDDTMSNTQFVNVMYQNVLKRAGETGGVSFWVNSMNGGMSRETVLMNFAASPENIANTPTIDTLQQIRLGYWDIA